MAAKPSNCYKLTGLQMKMLELLVWVASHWSLEGKGPTVDMLCKKQRVKRQTLCNRLDVLVEAGMVELERTGLFKGPRKIPKLTRSGWELVTGR